MDGLFRRAFTTFGPTTVAPTTEPFPLEQVRGRSAAKLRSAVREHCLSQPGVYGMLDAHQQLIYVGKAKSVRARLLSYFRRKSRDPKAGRIMAHTRRIVWEYTSSEFAALLRELELIRRWRPRFNVQGQPRRHRRAFVCLGRQPAPYLFLSRRPPNGIVACFGPIPARRQAQEALRRLNDAFGLRDCTQQQTMHFAEQGELFPIERTAGCLRYELGTCLGPCVGACTRTQYQTRVRQARAFLEGTNDQVLRRLEQDMTAASQALDFERAAILRDKLSPMRWLFDHLDRLRSTRSWHSFIYPILGRDGSEWWYLIRGSRVIAVVDRPVCPATTQRACQAIRTIFKRNPLVPDGEDLDAVLLVARWFRRYPQEKERTICPDRTLQELGQMIET